MTSPIRSQHHEAQDSGRSSAENSLEEPRNLAPDGMANRRSESRASIESRRFIEANLANMTLREGQANSGLNCIMIDEMAREKLLKFIRDSREISAERPIIPQKGETLDEAKLREFDNDFHYYGLVYQDYRKKIQESIQEDESGEELDRLRQTVNRLNQENLRLKNENENLRLLTNSEN